jgi:ATP-dependent Lon protease
MSATENDDLDLPPTADDAVSTGAAADSADRHDRLKGLPRLLRYAMLIIDRAGHIEERLIAEINELCPQLPHNAAWAALQRLDTGLALAAELDRRAVTQNEPSLRSLADCVRLVCLPTPRDSLYFEEYRRVGKALVRAFHVTSGFAERQLCCDLERFTFGWAALAACTDLLPKGVSAAMNAAFLGSQMAEQRISAAKAAARSKAKEEEERRKEQEAEETAAAANSRPPLQRKRLPTIISWSRASRRRR